MHLIEAHLLIKRYGEIEALKGVSFRVAEGSCFGLLGPNGAGKSTTLGILSGALDPTAGTLAFDGRSWREAEGDRRRQIGYVPQDLALYNTLSALENLRFWGRMYGVAAGEVGRAAAAALAGVGLTGRADAKVATFSGGMKRRLNLAAAIMHRPRLLLLDEPLVGVDPQSRNLLIGVLRDLNGQGTTMIYTSHYMQEVEQLCDRVAIIDHGQVLADDTLQGLLDRSEGGVLLRTESPEAVAAAPWQDWLPQAEPLVRAEGVLIRTQHPTHALPEVARRAEAAGWILKGLEVIQPSLESVFLATTGTALRD